MTDSHVLQQQIIDALLGKEDEITEVVERIDAVVERGIARHQAIEESLGIKNDEQVSTEALQRLHNAEKEIATETRAELQTILDEVRTKYPEDALEE